MMERYKGYWITGDAVPGPPYTHYWESFGTILKDGRLGSVQCKLTLERLKKFGARLVAVTELSGLFVDSIHNEAMRRLENEAA